MKRINYVFVAAGAATLLATAGLLRSCGPEAAALKAAPSENTISAALIAAPGRVEAVSEEVRVSSELSGRLKTVNVEEGDRVQRGQVLAEIENDDYRARVNEART